jgi:hypothetical protein
MTMIPSRTLIYDCEILRAIAKQGEERFAGIEYCDGWRDFGNMGISCICAWSEWDHSAHVFLADNLRQFESLAWQAEQIVGFNSLCFDDPLCQSHGIQVNTTFDLLRAVWLATDNPPVFTKGVTRPGYSLDSLAVFNLGKGKSGSGELAPVLWQRGERGRVIEYCLRDIALTRTLLHMATEGTLCDPNDGSTLTLEFPWSHDEIRD